MSSRDEINLQKHPFLWGVFGTIFNDLELDILWYPNI
jgi:hypothetical protein